MKSCYNVDWRVVGSMYVVFMSRQEKLFREIFNKLRGCVPNANISMINQISAYITRSGFVDYVDYDMKLEYLGNKDISVIKLNNGISIEFNDYSGEFGFIIKRKDGKMSMNTIVSLCDINDPSSINIYSELKLNGYGMYVVTFRPKDLCDKETLKYGTINYYTEDEIDWVRDIALDEIDNNFDLVAKKNFIFPFAEKSEFELIEQTDIISDNYQGYISNMLLRIDLLYNNMKFIRIKRKNLMKNR